jgi:hypothetical protein
MNRIPLVSRPGHHEDPMFLRLLANILAAVLIAQAASAQTLDAPAGEALLTVTGAIAVTNADGAAVFDRAMLESMEPVTFTTKTMWTDGPQVFTGVLLVDLLALVGVAEGTLRATAINDYAVDIPVSDAVEGGPIVAYLLNGQPMSIRDKGPLWIVYPYDAKREYRSEVIYSRSIWQLDRLEVRP